MNCDHANAVFSILLVQKSRQVKSTNEQEKIEQKDEVQ